MSSRWSYPTEPLAHPDAIVSGDKWRFTVLADGLLRYEWADDGKFEDRASSFAVNRKLPVPGYESMLVGDILVLKTARFRLNFNLSVGEFNAVSFWVDLENNTTQADGRWRFGSDYGNLGGTRRTLDRADGRIPLGKGVLSRSGFAFIDDTKSFLFEQNGWFSPRPEGNRVDGYLFAYGQDYQEAIKAFYTVSGKQPLIPRWALGNWWSRYHPYSAKEYLDLMDKFKEHKIPISVGVLDMDWHRTNIPPKYGRPWTGYTWNRELIPDPPAFLKALHQRGLRVTLNDHPHLGVRAFEELYPAMAKRMGRDPSTGDTLEFDCTDPNYMESFFDVVAHSIEKQGCDFWWVDWQQGQESKWPGVDPLWILNHYHYLDHARNGNRPLNFTRWPGPGGQRYPIGFSGDTVITWDSLKFQPEFTATASNIGYGWWSHDIGGHMHGWKDDELTTRWFQLGCFSPILRPHYSPNPFISREPWDLNPEAEKIITETMQFRHRLIPYLYSMNARSAIYNEPLVRPMYWEYPHLDDSYTVPNQYFFGQGLIVAPITSPRHDRTFLGSVEAWLPSGKYVDLSNGMVYTGGRKITLHRTIDKYPHLAGEGSIIPMNDSNNLSTAADLPYHVEIVVVVGKDGKFELFEDDGDGTSPMIGDFEGHDPHPSSVKMSKTDIIFDQKAGTLTIKPMLRPNKLSPGAREWSIRFVSHTSQQGPLAASLRKPGSHTSRTFAPETKEDKNGSLVLTVVAPVNEELVFAIGPDPQLRENDIVARSWDVIFPTIAAFDRKLQLFNAIKKNGTREETWARVEEIGGLPKMREALEEVIFSDHIPEQQAQKKQD
jgi:hypothetical protein